MRKVEFTCLARLPRHNDYDRMHWTYQRELQETWKWLILEAMNNAGFRHIGNTSYFKSKVVVDVTVYVKDKRGFRDEANLKAMIDKLILDALFWKKYKGQPKAPVIHLLVDDGPEYVTWGEIKQLVNTPERVHIKMTAEEE